MWQVTEKKNIFSFWLSWHYAGALQGIYFKWKEILRFNLDYFSIPFLVKTIFAPWRRYKFSFGKGFNIGKVAEVVVFNTFSRLVGAVVRTMVIITGLITHFLILFFGIFITLCWLLLPLIILFGLLISLQWLILI